nr:unnamed protein product [Digitaria exilis]
MVELLRENRAPATASWLLGVVELLRHWTWQRQHQGRTGGCLAGTDEVGPRWWGRRWKELVASLGDASLGVAATGT